MSDITKCPGNDCPLKDKCKRFTESSSSKMWFTEAPFTIEHGKFNCDMFSGESADHLLVELQSIMGGKK